jgi:hypothetical protein
MPRDLFASNYCNQFVVVVDNGSKDSSLSKLAAGAEGYFSMPQKTDAFRQCVPIAYGKPIPFVTLNLDDAACGRGWDSGVNLFFIDGARNHGFAGGVNIGTRFALANSAVRYVWILNNDTVVAPDCLSRMERRLRDEKEAAMCGSRILFYWRPDRVQVLGGGRFSRWTGTSRLLGNGESVASAVDVQAVESSLDHLSGASMLVSRHFIEKAGLMDEGYFLYYEELDWVMRGKNRYRLVYADDAVVFHKEGASIGSSHRRTNRSPLSCFFMVRSRLRFTRKFFPWALPSVFLYSVLVSLRALSQGHYEQAHAVYGALRGLNDKEVLGCTRMDKSRHSMPMSAHTGRQFSH